MKTKSIFRMLLLSCFGVILFSCNDTEEKVVPREQSKLEKMTTLYEKYGWKKEEGVSTKEFEEFLLSWDYEKMKDFFELMGSKKPLLDLTDEAQFTLTRSRSMKQNYNLQGHHSSYFATSNTYMTVKYDTRTVTVIDTEVQSNPSCDWYPEDTGDFYFSNNRCDIFVPGKVKYGFISRRLTMQAYLELYSGSINVKEGGITHFH